MHAIGWSFSFRVVRNDRTCLAWHQLIFEYWTSLKTIWRQEYSDLRTCKTKSEHLQHIQIVTTAVLLSHRNYVMVGEFTNAGRACVCFFILVCVWPKVGSVLASGLHCLSALWFSPIAYVWNCDNWWDTISAWFCLRPPVPADNCSVVFVRFFQWKLDKHLNSEWNLARSLGLGWVWISTTPDLIAINAHFKSWCDLVLYVFLLIRPLPVRLARGRMYEMKKGAKWKTTSKMRTHYPPSLKKKAKTQSTITEEIVEPMTIHHQCFQSCGFTQHIYVDLGKKIKLIG